MNHLLLYQNKKSKEKVVKVSLFQEFLLNLTVIQKFDLCLLETGAFLAADIASILAKRAGVAHLQIISRIAGRKQ